MTYPPDNLISITMEECRKLILAGYGGRIRFGPGWVGLEDTPENECAVHKLREIREKEGGKNDIS